MRNACCRGLSTSCRLCKAWNWMCAAPKFPIFSSQGAKKNCCFLCGALKGSIALKDRHYSPQFSRFILRVSSPPWSLPPHKFVSFKCRSCGKKIDFCKFCVKTRVRAFKQQIETKAFCIENCIGKASPEQNLWPPPKWRGDERCLLTILQRRPHENYFKSRKYRGKLQPTYSVFNLAIQAGSLSFPMTRAPLRYQDKRIYFLKMRSHLLLQLLMWRDKTRIMSLEVAGGKFSEQTIIAKEVGHKFGKNLFGSCNSCA